MTNFTQFLILSFTVLFFSGFSQVHQLDVDVNPPKRLVYGDFYYAPNLNGLADFVSDLEHQDYTTHLELQKLIAQYENKRTKHRIAGTSVTAVGTGMIVLGAVKFANSERNNSVFDADYQPGFKKNMGFGYMIAGGVLSIIGPTIFLSGEVSEHDIYRFINKHNQVSKNQKLKWEVGFTSDYNIGTGLRLGLSF